MAVNYKKLFHLLIEKDMTNAQLQKQAGFSGNIITRLKRNSYVSLESIETICRVLNCGVDDILEFSESVSVSETEQSFLSDKCLAKIISQSGNVPMEK